MDSERKQDVSDCVASTRPHKGDPTRRPYASPQLREYGSIARLTHTGGSTNSEFGVPRMKKSCL